MLTDDQAKALATEIDEAVPAIRTVVGLPRADQVLVCKHLIDKQIGTDPNAPIKNIPGLTPEITEAITDPLLEVAANALIALLLGPEVTPPA